MDLPTQVQSRLQIAEQVCKESNVRLTKKRRQVLVLLLLTVKAKSAYALIELFETHYKEILLPMTAYRTLEFLEEVQLVHRLKTTNKYIACSHIGCKSSHDLPHFFICERCLRVDEMNNIDSHSLCDLTNKAEQTGYQLSSPQIELSGVCNTCLLSESSH